MRNNMKCLVRGVFATAALAAWSATASAANILSDGSFEGLALGNTDWMGDGHPGGNANFTLAPEWRFFAVGGAVAKYTITGVANRVSDGDKALVIERGPEAGGDAAADMDDTGLWKPILGNRIYKLAADVKNGPWLGASTAFSLSQQIRASDNTFLGGASYSFVPSGPIPLVSGGFERVGAVGLSPTTAAKISVRMDTSLNSSVCVDNVVLEDATVGVNRLINGGFENSATQALNWRYYDTFGGNAGALVSGVGVGGSQAFQLTRNNFGGDTGLDLNDYKTPVIAGEKLQIAFDAKQVSGNAGTQLLFTAAQYNSAQGFLGAELVHASINPTSSGYTTYHYLVDVPSGDTALINPAFRVIDDTGSYLIDNVAVVGVPHMSITVTANPLGGDAASHTDRFEGATVTSSTNIHPVSDPRDILGGMFSSVEAGNTLGVDGNAGGTWSVSFHTASSVTIRGFNLFLGADGDHSNNRAASGFALFQGNTLVAQGNLAPYFSTYGNDSIKVAVGFDAPVSGQEWKLEITNYNLAGARVFELDAIPEPSTLVLLATGLIGMLAYVWRKRR